MIYKSVLFSIAESLVALPVNRVERVFRAVAVTPFPNAPEIILGSIIVEGKPLPVVSFYKRIGKVQPAITPETHFILIAGLQFRFIIPVDAVTGYAEVPEEEIIPAHSVWRNIAHTHGVFLLNNNTLFLADVDSFFTDDELSAISSITDTTDTAL